MLSSLSASPVVAWKPIPLLPASVNSPLLADGERALLTEDDSGYLSVSASDHDLDGYRNNLTSSLSSIISSSDVFLRISEATDDTPDVPQHHSPVMETAEPLEPSSISGSATASDTLAVRQSAAQDVQGLSGDQLHAAYRSFSTKDSPKFLKERAVLCERQEAHRRTNPTHEIISYKRGILKAHSKVERRKAVLCGVTKMIRPSKTKFPTCYIGHIRKRKGTPIVELDNDDSSEFSFTNMQQWSETTAQKVAVSRAMQVGKARGPFPRHQIHPVYDLDKRKQSHTQLRNVAADTRNVRKFRSNLAHFVEEGDARFESKPQSPFTHDDLEYNSLELLVFCMEDEARRRLGRDPGVQEGVKMRWVKYELQQTLEQIQKNMESLNVDSHTEAKVDNYDSDEKAHMVLASTPTLKTKGMRNSEMEHRSESSASSVGAIRVNPQACWFD